MSASGQDKRGQGSAKATIVSTMREEGDVTRVDVETDFTITGRLARFGRGGMIQDISNRLLKDFAECLQQRIEAPPAAEPSVVDAVLAATPEGAAAAPPAAGGSGRAHDHEADRRLLALLPGATRPAAPAVRPRLRRSSRRSHARQLAQEPRVDRVRHRRLAVGHVRAGLREPRRARRARTRPRSRGRACRGRSPRAGRRPCARSSSKPSTSGMKPLSAMIPAGRGRPGAEPERVRHHRALREAAEHRALGRDAVLGEHAVEPAGELRVGGVEGLADRGSRPAAPRTSARRPAAATAGRARWRRAGAARGRACRAAGTGRARRRRVRGRAPARPRARLPRGGTMIASATTLQQRFSNEEELAAWRGMLRAHAELDAGRSTPSSRASTTCRCPRTRCCCS